MDPNLPPHSASSPETPRTPPPERKRVSPLVVVLGLSVAFFAVFLLISGVIFMSRGGRSRSGTQIASPSFFSEQGSVGVIELQGEIKESKKLIKKLKAFEDDDDIKAVVLRIDSPGGAVAPSQEIYEEVKNYKKPIIASMGSVAASGAFYVACGTRKIFADPGTITGSIGVIMEFANLEKLYAWAKIQRYSIKTGKFKDMGAEYRPMTPEERDLLEGMVQNVLLQFKTAVATGRKLSLAQVSAIADGRIFSGDQAKKEKLVDELGSLQDAIREAAKIVGIQGKPNVIYPARPRARLLDLLFSGDRDEDDDSESSTATLGARTGETGGLLGLAARILENFAGDLAGQAPVSAPSELGLSSPGIYWLWTGH